MNIVKALKTAIHGVLATLENRLKKTSAETYIKPGATWKVHPIEAHPNCRCSSPITPSIVNGWGTIQYYKIYDAETGEVYSEGDFMREERVCMQKKVTARTDGYDRGYYLVYKEWQDGPCLKKMQLAKFPWSGDPCDTEIPDEFKALGRAEEYQEILEPKTTAPCTGTLKSSCKKEVVQAIDLCGNEPETTLTVAEVKDFFRQMGESFRNPNNCKLDPYSVIRHIDTLENAKRQPTYEVGEHGEKAKDWNMHFWPIFETSADGTVRDLVIAFPYTPDNVHHSLRARSRAADYIKDKKKC